MGISVAVVARMNQESAVKLVLFVEDESASRVGYVTYLTAAGFKVQEAATGQAALSAARARRPDVIVLDLGLPDIDGWEVARQLRAAPATAAVPIIALTGSDLPHERVSAMRAGCDRHLAKPCVPQHLLEAIRLCIGDS
jgi:two-component system, cell cycle response regulator DivK